MTLGKRMDCNPLWLLGDNRITTWMSRFLCHVLDAHTTHCRGYMNCREARRWPKGGKRAD